MTNNDPDAALQAARSHHLAGRLAEAEQIYRQVLKAQPDNADVMSKLGAAVAAQGRLGEAVTVLRSAVDLCPGLIDAQNNLGAACRILGLHDEAITACTNALDLDPDSISALVNIGAAYQELGRVEDAINSFKKALAIEPNMVEANVNLGVALQKLDRPQDAVVCYRNAITVNPGLPDPHVHLGTALQGMGQLEDAVVSYQKAIALNPNFADAHSNLGTAFRQLGRLEDSVASYRKALTIKPDYADAWHNLKYAVKALGCSSEEGLPPTARADVGFAMMEYYLARFRPHEAAASVDAGQAAMPSKQEEEVIIDAEPRPPGPDPLPDAMVGLLHFGRSGTGLLHSLIDGHPEISTLPGIFTRGFFNDGVWKRLSSDGWRRLPENFSNEFEALFDAASPRPTPSQLGEDSIFMGVKDGMTTLGDGRNEVLHVDREKFCQEALQLMSGFEKIDPMIFLRIVHAAYERTIRTGGKASAEKHLAFYHIHNPDDFALLNFLRYAPDTRLLMMVREPIQSCESWIRISFRDNDYAQIALRIIAMLFDIDRVCFRIRDSIGVRLEDLKSRPKKTMKSLCAWMGIKESTALYQMTVQGKKWWGDPTSPDYDKDKAMEPFGTASTVRPIGAVFSERDQLVLRTLYYPFSVRFGYAKADPDGFRKNLAAIRPQLDDLFDFEILLAEQSGADPARFKQSGSYHLLRAALLDRWQVLDELGDYPGMLVPLELMPE